MPEQKTLKCPSCSAELVKANIEGRRNIWRCPKEDTLYRLKTKRTPKSKFDPNDSTTWRATCIECGNKNMEYYNYKYHCPNPKCGHILYV